jgi:DNA polymerase-3 subunit delta'
MPLPPLRGHEEARARLARTHLAGNLPQSLLLHGPEGIGKERLGLWLAQLLLCENPSVERGPCGACLPCRLVDRLEHPDVHWFFPLPRPDAASPEKLREKLEDARAAELQQYREHPGHVPSWERAPAHFLASILTLQQLAAVRPAMGSRKVFVVGDAERMVPQESSPEAANAFLKLLEEPPADTVLILTSSQPGALLPTIRSRVLPLRLAPLAIGDVAGFLAAELGLEADAAERIAGASRGAIGRALRSVPTDGKPGALERQRLHGRDLLLAALSASAVPRMAAAHHQAPAGGRGDFAAELDALGDWLRDLLAVASGAASAVPDAEARSLLQRAVDQHGIGALQAAAALGHLADAQELARGNVNPQLILAALLRDVQREVRSASAPASAGR